MELTGIRLQLTAKKKNSVNSWYATSKRAIDIVVSVSALLVLSPLLLTVAFVIKLTSKGPVIYTQNRVGENGHVILFPKFRSMIQEADTLLEDLRDKNNHKDGYTFKMKKDPRVTTVGHIIRKFSIDELPQLWLVLVGEMTLVGPRPALIEEVEKYDEGARQRLAAKPGLTCIWQVSGRGDIPFKEQLAMDIKYIKERSLMLDLKLLLLTVPAVLTGKGAY
ncbi:MAG: sugar transferase [Lentisphaeraceae bacterium]|nr:sugar transferase [Lentisphaeraceae bacterium]